MIRKHLDKNDKGEIGVSSIATSTSQEEKKKVGLMWAAL